MTGQQNLTAEAIQRGAVPGRGYELASRVSQVFHPITLGIVNFFIIGLFGVFPWWRGLFWAFLGIGLQVVPPTLFFTIRLHQGAYSDEDVSVRQQRNELYLFTMAIVIVSLIAMQLLNAPLPFLALICSGAVINVLYAIINLYWKISMHAAGVATCATTALIYSIELGALLWLGVLLVGWARVRTRNHTPAQVAAGGTLAAICVLGVFMGFGLL